MTVYVCSPYCIQDNELERTCDCCASELELGNVPFAPQLFFPQFLQDAPDGVEDVLLGLELLCRLDEVHVYGERQNERMRKEIAYANSIGIPVVYM